MTTVAFDGRMMAADTLATDAWGMKERVDDKILRGLDFLCGTGGDILTATSQGRPAITDTERVDFIAAGAFVGQEITDGVERWHCHYGIDQRAEGSSMREAIDNAIQ